MSMLGVIPSKSVGRYELAELKRFIFEAGRIAVCLQSDRVSSGNAWVGAVSQSMFPKAIRLAQWLLNHLVIHVDGLAACQSCFRQQSLPGLVENGEILLLKARGGRDVDKADSSVTEVCGSGKGPSSGKHTCYSALRC